MEFVFWSLYILTHWSLCKEKTSFVSPSFTYMKVKFRIIPVIKDLQNVSLYSTGGSFLGILATLTSCRESKVNQQRK